MKLTILPIAAVLATGVLAAPAMAQTATILTQAEAANAFYPTTESGYSISYGGNYATSLDGYIVGGGADMVITRAAGGTFQLQGLDVQTLRGNQLDVLGFNSASTEIASVTLTSTSSFGPADVSVFSGVNLASLEFTEVGEAAAFANVKLFAGAAGGAVIVPEPATLGLFGSVLAVLALRRRRAASRG